MRKIYLRPTNRFAAVLIVMGTLIIPRLMAAEDQSEPPVVMPGLINSAPPSDGIVLFDGTDLSQWQGRNGKAAEWEVHDGAVTVVKKKGSIVSKEKFGDCQLHIEWRTPENVVGDGQKRGNSGIFLQGRYELQVLDSYDNKTYPNGQAGAVYKQHVPLVNVCRKPGEWQAYDIIYTAPRFKDDGTVESPAFITVLQNGVLIQNHVEIKGNTSGKGQKYTQHELEQPLMLQDHSDPVSYRNIWIRKL